MKLKQRNSGFIKKALTGSALLMAASVQAYVPADTSTEVNISPIQFAETDRLIVTFNDNAPENSVNTLAAASTDQLSSTAGMNMSHVRRTGTGSHVVKLDYKVSPAYLNKVMANIAAQPNVANVELDIRVKPLFTPNDARYNEQWHYFESTGGLNLPTAWDTATGTGVNVGVIDTGYVFHSDLDANIIGGYDFISDATTGNDGDARDGDPSDPGDWTVGQCGFPQDSSWHGTHVAGTIAAVSNNGTGVAGVAFNSKVVPIRGLGTCGGFISDIADGIIWGAGGNVPGVPANPNPSKVLNLSLGGGGACGSTTQNAINTARSLGTTVVVAAGNSNTNAANATPANCAGVVAVAATDRDGNRAFYSNFGSVVDVAAPGGETNISSNGVLSTLNSGSTTPSTETYAFYQGTSMATPHVAGVAALLYEVNPSITPDEVENILKNTARSFPGICSQCGSGIVDAAAAVAAAAGGGGGGPAPTPTPLPDGELRNGVPVTGLAGATGSEQFFTIELPADASNLSVSINGGSGDADLYVRFGSEPATSTYDCRPYRNGNSETCSFSSPSTGTYHIMVRSFNDFSGVTLTASYNTSSSGLPVTLTEENIADSARSWEHFTLDVPAGAFSLVASITGGTGDADLYVRFGSRPTTSTYDCRPYRNGNNETCTFDNPQAGTWHISVRAFRSYTGLNLEAVAE